MAVPCGRKVDDPNTEIDESVPCSFCHLFVLAKRVVDYTTINIIIPLAILMIVIGGVMFLTAGGDPGKVTQGKKILGATLIGIIIIFIGWLIVDTIITFLTPADSPFQQWDTINCEVAMSPLATAREDTCAKVNPVLCGIDPTDDTNRGTLARIPVDDFDANKNGIINEHRPDGSYPTTYCIDDNLETLCGFYYGCKIDPCPEGDKTGFDPFDPANYNLVTDEEWIDWYNCCIVNVCGCQ